MLKETFVIVLATQIIASMKVYDIVYVMTDGGPANSTQTLATYMYNQTFTYSNLGVGSAIATVMVLIMMVVIVPYVAFSTKDEQGRCCFEDKNKKKTNILYFADPGCSFMVGFRW